MTDLFLTLLNRGIAAGWLVLAVLLLRLPLKKAPRWASPLLWGVVGLRLCLPVSIPSPLSLIPSAATVSAQSPAIQSGVPALNSVVNPALESVASVHTAQLWLTAAGIVWLLGAAAMLLYALGSYLRLRRRLRTAVRLWENIYQSEFVASPFVLGLVHPRIYLPYRMAEETAVHVIAHERAHIRRRDQWSKPAGLSAAGALLVPAAALGGLCPLLPRCGAGLRCAGRAGHGAGGAGGLRPGAADVQCEGSAAVRLSHRLQRGRGPDADQGRAQLQKARLLGRRAGGDPLRRRRRVLFDRPALLRCGGYERQCKLCRRTDPVGESPTVTLYSDGTFHFMTTALSSYYCTGSYTWEGERLTLRTADGRYTYVFDLVGDDLAFDATASSENTWGAELSDGTVLMRA